MGTYLAISLVTSLFMNLYNRRVQVMRAMTAETLPPPDELDRAAWPGCARTSSRAR